MTCNKIHPISPNFEPRNRSAHLEGVAQLNTQRNTTC